MQLVDIRTIVKNKAPKASRFLPGFVYSWLERILHQDEVNFNLSESWDQPPQQFIRDAFERWQIHYTIEGLDCLDKSQRYIFAANHPFGGMDGMMIADKLIEYFGDARVVVNDILMHLTPLTPIWVPVNTLGAQNPEYARRFAEAFEGDLPILNFPAGVCSREIDGKITDLRWKPTFIRRAQATGRQIVPLYVEGGLHKGFYRLYKFRKALGIKANIEMLLLVDGMFRQKRKTFRLIAGDPLTVEQLKEVGSIAEQTQYVRDRVYALPQK